MSIALWTALAVVAILLVVLLGGLVELFRQIEQIRTHLGLIDAPTPVPFGRNAELPVIEGMRAVDRSDERSVVLVLSEDCSTCATIAQALADRPPRADLGVVLVPGATADGGIRWAKANRMPSGHPFAVDVTRSITSSLGVSVSPVAVRFVGGQPDTAATVPSPRQLDVVIAWLDGVRVGAAAPLKEAEL